MQADIGGDDEAFKSKATPSGSDMNLRSGDDQ